MRKSNGPDPLKLRGRLVRITKHPIACVYEVIEVAGVYVRLGPTKRHPLSSKRAPHRKWHDWAKLYPVEVHSEQETVEEQYSSSE